MKPGLRVDFALLHLVHDVADLFQELDFAGVCLAELDGIDRVSQLYDRGLVTFRVPQKLAKPRLLQSPVRCSAPDRRLTTLATSLAPGWKVCGSAPTGTRLKTSTWSPPTFSTQSATMLFVTTTLIDVGGAASAAAVGAAASRMGVALPVPAEHAARTNSSTICRKHKLSRVSHVLAGT